MATRVALLLAGTFCVFMMGYGALLVDRFFGFDDHEAPLSLLGWLGVALCIVGLMGLLLAVWGLSKPMRARTNR